MTARAKLYRVFAAALAFVSVLSSAAVAEDSNDAKDALRFTYSQAIDAPDSGAEYLSFALGPEQYRACRDDLGDIRIFDSLGAQCPYVLDSREVRLSRETKRVGAVETGRGSGGEGDGTVSWREFQIVEFEEPLEINALALDVAPGDYSVRLEVFARDAKTDWVRIATDTVYRMSGVEKSSIELDSIVSYPFWRVESRGKDSPFGNVALSAVLDRERSETSEFRRNAELAFSLTSKKGRTTITVENPDRLAVSSVSLEAPAPFRRTVRVVVDKTPVAGDEVYRIGRGADEARKTAVELGYAARAETIELTIEDGDDSPLAVSKVTAEYAVDKVVFRPSGKPPYVLAFGNAAVERPAYDMGRYRDEIDDTLVRTVGLLSVVKTEGFAVDASDGDAGKTVFSIVVVATSIALSALVVVTLFRRKDAPTR